MDVVDTDYTLNNLSLREAIALAADGNHLGTDGIYFAPWVDEIDLTGGQFTIASGNNIELHGLGADRLTIDAQTNSRVFQINSGATVTLSDLHITRGKANGANGGAIISSGVLTIERCQIDFSTSTSHGGAVYHTGSSLTIADSTVSSNSAAGIGGGGVASGIVTIVNSTVSSNTAVIGGGGMSMSGASGKQVINSTITANSVTGSGGGIAGTNVLLYNSIVAGNSGSSATRDISGTYNASSSNNFIGYDSSLTNGINNGGTNNNQVGGESGAPAINPLLGPLALNGGRTKTHALLDGSDAIDAGNNTFASGLNYDQRAWDFVEVDGVGDNSKVRVDYRRIINGGVGLSDDTVDIGAYEYGPGTTIGGGGSGAVTISAESKSVSDGALAMAISFVPFVDSTAPRTYPSKSIHSHNLYLSYINSVTLQPLLAELQRLREHGADPFNFDEYVPLDKSLVEAIDGYYLELGNGRISNDLDSWR